MSRTVATVLLWERCAMSGARNGPTYLAGIDLGSTSLKCIIYDLAGNVVAHGSRPTERVHPDAAHPDWTVWDPAQIWGGAAAAAREATGPLGDARCIAAVAVTGMGMDGLPVDESGAWLYPPVVGRQHRGRADLRHRRKHVVAFRHGPAPALDGRARTGHSCPHTQVAPDRGFPELHALRHHGHRLQHGLVHDALRPARARVVAGAPLPVFDRRRPALRSPPQRHCARRDHRERRCRNRHPRRHTGRAGRA